MGHEVVLTLLAEGDLEEIVSFIAEDNPEAALATGRQIIERLEHLTSFPLSGRVVPEFGDDNLREIVHSHYRIVYQIVDEAKRIEVVRIWHGARGDLPL